MYLTLLLLTLLYSTALAADPSLPSFKNFICEPCAHPITDAVIEFPRNSPACYEVGQKIFNWPSGENCSLPLVVYAYQFRVDCGIATATEPFCTKDLPGMGYEFMCGVKKGGGKNRFMIEYK